MLPKVEFEGILFYDTTAFTIDKWNQVVTNERLTFQELAISYPF